MFEELNRLVVESFAFRCLYAIVCGALLFAVAWYFDWRGRKYQAKINNNV